MIKIKILIVLPGGIGNSVLFSPVYNSILNYFDNPEIYLLTSNQNGHLIFVNNKNLKKIFVYNHKSKLSFLKLFFRIMLFYKFDFFISSMGISSWKSGILSLISKARIRCGEKSIFFTHQTEPDYNKHELERNIEIIKKIIPEKYISCKPVIFSDKQIIQSANKIWNENNLNNFKVIGIHLGSNEFMKAKRWDINKFNELINKLYYENDDIKIVLFGGPDEYEYSKQIKNNRIINFVSKFDLITSSELIKKCSVFVSNDSGLMHIAAAQSVPVIAIFGPTIISKNRPYSEKSKVVSLNLDCQPCYKYNEQIECDRNFECIKNISVNTVYTEVIKKIND